MKSTLQALPLDWIKRIFTRFNAVYGPALMRGTWGDSMLDEVMLTWAEELKNFHDHPSALKYALENLPKDYPPNLLQFREIAREGLKHETKPIGIEEKITNEQMETNIERVADLVKIVKSPSNDRKWIYRLKERHDAGERFSFEVERIFKEACVIEGITL